MIAGLRRWIRGDNAADQRIKVLEGELQRERELRASGREMYLTRLDRCIGCATCNPEPESFTDLPDYELGDTL